VTSRLGTGNSLTFFYSAEGAGWRLKADHIMETAAGVAVLAAEKAMKCAAEAAGAEQRAVS